MSAKVAGLAGSGQMPSPRNLPFRGLSCAHPKFQSVEVALSQQFILRVTLDLITDSILQAAFDCHFSTLERHDAILPEYLQTPFPLQPLSFSLF
jgi:hypothetical protein